MRFLPFDGGFSFCWCVNCFLSFCVLVFSSFYIFYNIVQFAFSFDVAFHMNCYKISGSAMTNIRYSAVVHTPYNLLIFLCS